MKGKESVNKYNFKTFGWQNCYSVRSQSIVETLTFVRYLFAKICKINEKYTTPWKNQSQKEKFLENTISRHNKETKFIMLYTTKETHNKMLSHTQHTVKFGGQIIGSTKKEFRKGGLPHCQEYTY